MHRRGNLAAFCSFGGVLPFLRSNARVGGRAVVPAMLWLGLCLGSCQPASAARIVTLGPTDFLPADQPRVAMEVFTQPTTGQPVSLGPDMSNTFLLDTGASTFTAVGNAIDELRTGGYQTVAIYDEQGVAGFTPMDVSQKYRVDFAGGDGQRIQLPDVRMLSNPDLNFGGFNGIIGMPAMVNRIATVDMHDWAAGDGGFLGVHFPATLPAPVGPPANLSHRYTVPLSLVEFPLTGQRNAGDPLPTDAPLPFAAVQTRHGNLKVEGKFLIDTGAQLSIISTATAFALGLDTNGNMSFDEESLGEIEVGGIGGTVMMPLLDINSLALHTEQGTDLVWTDLTLGVLDIDPKIAGVFGMDFLASGWLFKALVGEGDDGYFNQMHFDFRDAANMKGTLVLDLTPAHNIVVDPFPWQNPVNPLDVNGDLLVNATDLQLLTNALNSEGPHALGTPSGQFSLLDVNGDNFLSAFDLMLLNKAISENRSSLSADTPAVPEPGTLGLLLCGGLLLAVARARRAKPR